MKQKLLLITLAIACFSPVTFGQAAKVEGFVFDDKNNPVAALKILVPGGSASLTDRLGHFVITFPDDFKPGQAIRIQVAKPGWVIYEPFLGNSVAQSAIRNYDPLRVIIVPKGSPLLLSSARITQLVARLVDENATQSLAPNPKIHEYTFLRKYADEYGLKPETLKAALDQWAKTNESNDREGQILRTYWRGDYETSARLAGEAIPTEIEKAHLKVIEASRQLIRLFTLAGSAYYEQSKFTEAFSSFKKIEELFETGQLSKDDFREEWAETKLLLGNTRRELGTRNEGDEAMSILSQARRNYEEALSVFTREHGPQKWAATQNNLATVMSLMGERVAGQEGERLLTEAILHFHRALLVFSREQTAQDWAATQNNLGVTLRALAERSEGDESIKLFREAINAYGLAVTIRTRDQQPQDWATTQNNLGAALMALGERLVGAEGIKYLTEAVATYRGALTIRTREHYPRDWAATENNLAIALQSLSERVSDPDRANYLANAIATYREILEVRTRRVLPQEWAATQNNLGVALMVSAGAYRDERRAHLLKVAVEAYQSALEVRTLQEVPQQWAVTQNNLARAYLLLENWSEAASSYENVLGVYPAYEEAYQSLATIYEERLFEYEKAFQLHKSWLSQFPSDSGAAANFAETSFTTGRFNEFSERNRSVLSVPSLLPSTRAALQMIEVANLLALGKTGQVPDAISAVLEIVAQQKADFTINWSFNGTLHFIRQRAELSAYHSWLKELFGAATADNRDAILRRLREIRRQFKLQAR